MQSFPGLKTLSATGIFIIVPDVKCAVFNLSLQLTATNTSGTLSYSVDKTCYPLERASFPDYNASESLLNSQAQWVSVESDIATSEFLNFAAPLKGIRITMNTVGTGDSVAVAWIQQGII